MIPNLVSMDSRPFSKSSHVVWLIVFLLAIYSFIFSLDVWGKNLAHIRLVKGIPESPYRCAIMKTSCDQIIKSFRTDWAVYLKGDPILILFRQLPLNVESDRINSEPEHFSSRGDLDWLALGAEAYRQGLSDVAIEYWKNMPQIAHYLINLSYEATSPTQAIRLLNLSTTIMPTGSGYYEMGKNYFNMSEDNKAIKAYEQALILASGEEDSDILAKIYLGMGETFLRQGEAIRSQEYFEYSMVLQGSLLPGATIKLARSHIQQGQLDRASKILRDLLAEQADIARGWWWLGEVERMRGDTDQALNAYRRYKELNPDDDRVDERMEAMNSKR